MYRMTCDGFEVKGLNIEGVRKTLAYDGIKAYLTPRVLNNGPVEFRGLGGVWTVVVM